jgi:NADPH:quinone reductase-like Zn-dependent oxidoreductase
MTGIRQTQYGEDPERLLEVAVIPVPVPRAGEVLVRVTAASVDRGTWHLMAGLPYPVRLAGSGLRKPTFGNPGVSLSGTVAAVGDGTDGFAVGDEVFGLGRGALAEYAIAKAAKLAHKPGSVGFVDAAAVPVSGLAALQAVRDHAGVQSGERVLVYGGSGGVGSLAVQLAVSAGAHVTAVCSAKKAELVARLGASRVVPYGAGEPEGDFDVILDAGGNRPLRTLRRLLTPAGRLVIIGGENGGRWLGGSGRQVRAQMMSPFVSQRLRSFLASENAADLRVLAERISSGDVRPLIDTIHSLPDSAMAIRRLIDGHATGKVIVAVQ